MSDRGVVSHTGVVSDSGVVNHAGLVSDTGVWSFEGLEVCSLQICCSPHVPYLKCQYFLEFTSNVR